ncbi:MAG: DHA2 family efflux MFS transporter permease subunit [Gammaproteobacteria bacterium]|nr:DHA2 family efflux MFS transporter permease subunit [Gammaproteobacteria bacterium]
MSHPPLRGAALVVSTFALSLASFMQVLDTSIANVAIPTIAGDLAVAPQQGTWIITSFGVSLAIALPLTGGLARRFGEVRLFVGSVLLFTLASWGCGLADSLETLIVLRVVQGAVAGPMVPLSQSLLLSTFPPERKGQALALWAMTVVVAPIVGPVLGGVITDQMSWPWIFYINVPVGLFAAWLTWQMLGERDSVRARLPIDVVGMVLLVVWVGCLQVMLDKGHELDWFESPVIVTLAITSLVAFAYFCVWELTAEHPAVDLTLFRSRDFVVGTLAMSVGYMCFFGSIVIFPLWLQTQMGYTATWAGLAAAPIGVLSVILSPLVGRNLHRVDPRLIGSVAFFVFALASFWNAGFTTSASFGQLIVPRFIIGVGIACFFAPLTTITLTDLPPARIASASGLANFLRMLGGSFGASMSVSLWTHRESFHHSQLVEHLSPYEQVTRSVLGALGDRDFDTQTGTGLLARMVDGQAVMLATNDVFYLSGWIFLALLILVWFAHRRGRGIAPATPVAAD